MRRCAPTRWIVLSAAWLGLLACATSSGVGSPVLDLDPDSARGCRYLGDVTETQYSGMLFAGQGIEAARDKVRDSAAAMGATHVVWGSMSAGGAVQAASAKAYACPAADGSDEGA